jgi:hypothetical protein
MMHSTLSIAVSSETDLPALTVASDHERLFATENETPDFGQRKIDSRRYTWRTIAIARRLTFAI